MSFNGMLTEAEPLQAARAALVMAGAIVDDPKVPEEARETANQILQFDEAELAKRIRDARTTPSVTPQPNTEPEPEVSPQPVDDDPKHSRRELLIDTALRIIDKGEADLAIDRLAQESGVTRATVFQHFRSTAGLRSAISERIGDRVVVAIDESGALNDTEDLRKALQAAVEHYVGAATQHPNTFRFLKKTVPPAEQPAALVARALAAKLTRAETASPPAPEAVELAASTLLGAAASATDWWLGPDAASQRQLPPEQLVTYVAKSSEAFARWMPSIAANTMLANIKVAGLYDDSAWLWTDPHLDPGLGAEPRTYTVASGDTLWAIAERFYGDGSKYRQIASANDFANPELIEQANAPLTPGRVLTIPADT